MAEPAPRNGASSSTDPVELLRRLIRFDTRNPPGREAACIACIDDLLRGAGLETALLAADPARPNLVARLPGRGIAPPLLLYGHVDVAETAHQQWRYPPFAGVVADGYVWGRGALDMKGGIAMMLTAVLRAAEDRGSLPGDIILAVLSDEEGTAEYGARFLVGAHPEYFAGVRYAVGEFGGFSIQVGDQRFYPIQVAERRAGMVRLRLRGAAGHANLPLHGGTMAQLGAVLTRLDQHRPAVHVTPVARQFVTALADALPSPLSDTIRQLLDVDGADRALAALQTIGGATLSVLCEPLLWHTINPMVVRGAERNVGVIPGELDIELAVSVLPGYSEGELRTDLQYLLGEEAEITEVNLAKAGRSDPDLGLFDLLGDILREADPVGIPVPWIMPAVTDGRFFARLGIQTYGFLPMRLPAEFDFGRTIHAADERIPVDALSFGSQAIFQVLHRYGLHDAFGTG